MGKLIKSNSTQKNLEYVSCDLCGADNTEILFTGKDRMLNVDGYFNVVKCLKCDLIYINPRPNQKHIHEYYPVEYSPFDIKRNIISGWMEHKLIQKDISVLKKNVDCDAQILEIGCGNGEYLKSLKNTGFEVTGVELNPHAAKIAKEKIRSNVIIGTVFDGKFKDKSFDIIIMRHVLEHVPNPSMTIQEIYRILKDDGIFIFSTPNTNTIESVIFGKFWYDWDVPRHLYGFNSKTLMKILEKNNFKVSSVSYSIVPNNWIGSFKYWLGAIKAPSRITSFFNIQNVILLCLFFPISLTFGILKKSGRIQVIAKKL